MLICPMRSDCSVHSVRPNKVLMLGLRRRQREYQPGQCELSKHFGRDTPSLSQHGVEKQRALRQSLVMIRSVQ